MKNNNNMCLVVIDKVKLLICLDVIFELKNAFNDYESKSTFTKIIKSYYTQL